MKHPGAAFAAAIVILTSTGSPLPAQDYASWIQYTDRGDNPLIAQMIEEGDLSVALEMATALGRRQDYAIHGIILSVGQMANLRPEWERELILRTILVEVFSPALDFEQLERRSRENREGIDFLVESLPGFRDSLKREVIRLMAYIHPGEYLGMLMTEGRRMADLLRQQNGMLNGEQAGLILTFLETVGSISDPEFADIVLLILQRSRHLEVAEKARAVSRSLLLKQKS